MTDPAPASSPSPEDVYEPFPSFATWLESFSVDESLFATFSDRLAETKRDADPETMRLAIETATKWAAIDTGAIEGLYDVDRGFTFSVAATATAWDNIHLAKDDSTERAIKDALEAYDFVLDAATEAQPVTEMLIKHIHEIICRSQDEHTVITAVGPQKQEMPKGEYKQHANSPFNISTETVHAYASVLDTPPEMARLVAELASPEFAAAHPVAQASYAHYAFVCIHPFADGNGRVSRALASIYLYRTPGVPLVIFADQKNVYIDALEAADAGRYGAFQQFVADAAIDAIQLVVEQFKSIGQASGRESAAALREGLVGPGGFDHQEVDAAAIRLLDEFTAAMREADLAAALEPPLRASVQTYTSGGGQISTPAYRSPADHRVTALTVESAPPAAASRQLRFWPAIAKPTTAGAEFVIWASDGSIVFEAFLREVLPVVSSSLSYRLGLTASRLLSDAVAATASEAQDTLRRNGYI